jgi:hypothetical protein
MERKPAARTAISVEDEWTPDFEDVIRISSVEEQR